MRLIDYDKLILDLINSGIPYQADINSIIMRQPVISTDKLKNDLIEILEDYKHETNM